MPTADIADLTPKAKRTREHILTTALRLFAEKGYQQTTLRDIAAEAQCSLGLAYRYFTCKEELVTAVYEQCSEDLMREVGELPKGTMAARFVEIVRTNFKRLATYHEAFAAIAGIALNPYSEAGVLGARMGYLRQRVWGLFREVIAGAKDAPAPREVDTLATLFYAAYLLLMLFWVQDRSENQRSTEQILRFAEETIGRLRPLLKLPVFSRSASQLAGILSPMFGPGTA